MTRIAIIGAGVSGLVCAHLLHRKHEITLYEAFDRLGGHSNTIDVTVDGRTLPVDTGFIVFNEANYPNFTRILKTLGVASQETTMSFSVKCERTGFEYGADSALGLFAQKRNAVRPAFWAMLRDIRRFGARMREAAASAAESLTLGEHLVEARYSRAFVDDYLLPMAGAIWSAPAERMRDFPLQSFVSFFDNHGMLEPWRAPRWRTVVGGSREYVSRLSAPFRDRTRLASPVSSVVRAGDGVEVTTVAGDTARYDEVILAVHSDQALRLLADADDDERAILEAVPYQRNTATLHTDPAALPSRRRAWAAWNYLRPADPGETVRVTYLMNSLQRLPVSTPICVTLNDPGTIDRARIIREIEYHHPVYSPGAFDAQRRLPEVSGRRRVHFCGAWCGYGFHEDGVRSAVAACARFGASL
ncbi:MAG: NAD(P)/FAD-dependent oxidoreductase [Phycisphaerales bacterium]